MRKRLLFLLLALGLLLSACSGKTPSRMQDALDFRTALLSAGGCSFTASVAADYGETVSKFTLECRYDPAQGAHLRVTAPESIAGIEADVTGEDAALSFAGTELALGDLAKGNLAPLAAPLILARCWAEGYIDAAGREDACLRVTYLDGYGQKELTVDTWFLADSGWPARAEISYDGQTLLRLELTNFTMERGSYENTDEDLG